jgi:hypothetical protein
LERHTWDAVFQARPSLGGIGRWGDVAADRHSPAGAITDLPPRHSISKVRPMAEWMRLSRGRVVYKGRISRPPFVAWTETAEGRAAIKDLASRLGFSFLGRTRSARRRLWRHLATAVCDASVVAAIQREIDAYFKLHGDLAYADGLPRAGVELRRLVAVPCVLLNGAAYRSIGRRLSSEPLFAALEGGEGLRDFFILRLIQEIETAVTLARPSSKRPLAAGAEWITVGLNPNFEWRPPLLQGPSWNGHRYVLELTRQPVTRAIRKAVTASISRLEAALELLSRAQRQDILRRAQYRA